MIKTVRISFVLLFSYCYCVSHYAPNYPFDLDSAGKAIEGFVGSEAVVGSKIRIKPIPGVAFKENGKPVVHLQVVLRSGIRDSSVEFIVENTEAFKIDEDGYIIVNSTEDFDHDTAIEFYVVMFKGTDVVSDPVPFIVRAQKHKEEEHYEYNKTAAVFAGVLVCLIVALALLIPFVVRAKRRAKHGKPIFKPGSHPSALEIAMSQQKTEKGSQADLTLNMVNNHTTNPYLKGRSMTEGDFYDNYGFRLEKEMEREKNDLSHELLAIASHVEDLDEADNVIQLRKKHNSDSDSGVSSDAKNEKGKGILRNGRSQDVYSIEMEKREHCSDKPKTTTIEESAHL